MPVTQMMTTVGRSIASTPYVSTGLVEYLDSQDYSGTGSTWTARVGDDATLINAPTWTSGSSGYFNFAPASLQSAEAPNSRELSNWSVECWFRLTDTLSSAYDYPALVTTVFSGDYGNFYGSINYVLGTYPSFTSITTGFYTGYDGNWHNTGGTVRPANQWCQMVGTYNGSLLTTYVNGVEVVSAATNSYSSANGGPIRLARRWDGAANDSKYYMPADISIVRIYNRALNLSQIQQNYETDKARFGLT